MAKKKKKKSNPLLILLFALVLLIAGYFGTVKFIAYSEQKAVEESAAEEEANTIYMNRIEEFVAVAYTNERETLHFTLDQENFQWFSTEVPDFPVSYNQLTTVAYGLECLTADRKLEGVSAEDLEEYGLVTPAYTVRAEDAEGTEFVMYVGARNATTGDYYAQVEGREDVVYTINSNLVNYLEYDLYDLIEMETYPSVTEDALQKVEFVSESGNIVMERLEAELETEAESAAEADAESQTAEEETIQWNVTGDAAAEDLIAMVSGISFSSCVDYKVTEDTMTTYGFDAPTGKLTVTYADSSEEEIAVTLTIGAYDETNGGYYCLMDDSAMVNLVSASALSAIIPQ